MPWWVPTEKNVSWDTGRLGKGIRKKEKKAPKKGQEKKRLTSKPANILNNKQERLLEKRRSGAAWWKRGEGGKEVEGKHVKTLFWECRKSQKKGGANVDKNPRSGRGHTPRRPNKSKTGPKTSRKNHGGGKTERFGSPGG